ncbi:PilN domain-containing protein [Candidatus Kaiserbacteria bacterium]|nr:MAG: PilN domain-containing protein [Candidatus Kaiserbacteria bacterium]
MINLIPPAGYKVLKREYLLRIGASFSFLMAVVLFILTVSLAPTYILTSAQIADYETRISSVEDEAAVFKEAERQVTEAHIVLAQLQTTGNTVVTSDILHEIENVAPEGISFKTFSISASGQNATQTVQVQGVAPTREALVQFKNALENTTLFDKAEVPIADLARDANLPFAITISLQKAP